MAIDTRALLNGLAEYRSTLERHLSVLRDEFQELETRWRTFSDVYEGDAAEQFKEGWERTADRFNEYVERTGVIARLLDERVQYLGEANRASAEGLG